MSGVPSSLLQLTTQIVAKNIEKYPPSAFGVLSESQWDEIIRTRCLRKPSGSSYSDLSDRTAFTRPSSSSTAQPLLRLLLLPPLSAKHLLQIEQHPRNTHLSHSAIADELLWKQIVDYKFRTGSAGGGGLNLNRPSSLHVPCGYVQKHLKELGDTLLELCVTSDGSSGSFDAFVKRHCDDQKDNNGPVKGQKDLLFGEEDSDSNHSSAPLSNDHNQADEKEERAKVRLNLLRNQYRLHMNFMANRHLDIIQRICYSLSESPMDVRLLVDTKIGKVVTKVVKTLVKLKNQQQQHHQKKRKKSSSSGLDEEVVELREIFWKKVVKWDASIPPANSSSSNHQKQSSLLQSNQRERDSKKRLGNALVEFTPLEFLQQLLIDWKEMASHSGVEITRSHSDSVSATAATAATNNIDNHKRQRVETKTPQDNKGELPSPIKKNSSSCNNHEQGEESNNNNCYNNIRVTSCGRDKHISVDQHIIDMALLHSSPDWRSLYQSLTNRELDLRKVHGEKVRATREHLERDRPKIGKVILKKAVGRVRGGDIIGVGGLLRRDDSGSSGGCGGDGGQDSYGHSQQTSLNKGNVSNAIGTKPATQTSTFAIMEQRKAARQEAILNKSKGLRALQKQASSGSGGATSTKVAQIRQTSKVAAKWSKSSFGESVASAAAPAPAPAAVGGGGGGGGSNKGSGVRKVLLQKEQSQIHVSLQNGKTMKVPTASSAADVGKSSGKFSSLQQKIVAKNRGLKRK